MDKIASLKDLLTVGRAHHACSCSLDGPTRGSFTSGPSALWSAFMLRRCSIVMEDGRRFEIVITRYNPGRTALRFKLL